MASAGWRTLAYPEGARAVEELVRLDGPPELGYHPPEPSRTSGGGPCRSPAFISLRWSLASAPTAPPRLETCRQGPWSLREGVETYSKPDERAFPLDRLPKGQSILILDSDEETGWLAVAPPGRGVRLGRTSVGEAERPSVAVVTVDRRPSVGAPPGARMPGPPTLELDRGTRLTLLDLPPLVTATNRRETTWLAVAPPKGGLRFIRSEGVDWRPGGEAAKDHRRPVPHLLEPPATVADAMSEIAAIEARHRSILAWPIASWRPETVRSDYERLKARSDNAASDGYRGPPQAGRRSRAPRPRGQGLRKPSVARSRRRDREVEATRRGLADAPEQAESSALRRGRAGPALVKAGRWPSVLHPDRDRGRPDHLPRCCPLAWTPAQSSPQQVGVRGDRQLPRGLEGQGDRGPGHGIR